jgi:hypothetical protein
MDLCGGRAGFSNSYSNKMEDEEIIRRYNTYLVQRYKKFVSSGCCLCWDICSCHTPIIVGEEERKAYGR